MASFINDRQDNRATVSDVGLTGWKYTASHEKRATLFLTIFPTRRDRQV